MHGKAAYSSGTLDPQECTGPLHHGHLNEHDIPGIDISAISNALKRLGHAIISIDLVAVSQCGSNSSATRAARVPQ